MALTRSDIPDLLLPGLKAEFDLAYRNELDQSTIEQIATVVNTTQPVQKYAWLGSTPPMREFIDERRPGGIAPYSLTIEDKVFESTIAVERKAIEDDQLDLIRLRIRDLAYRVNQHRHQMIVELLAAGSVTNGSDGVPFFGTAHPVNNTTWSNKTSSALSATSLADAFTQMMGVPDDTGTPLGIIPDTLVVGPKLQWAAMELTQSPVVVYKGNATDSAGSTPYKNAFFGRLNLVVTPYLNGGSDDYWFMLDTKRPIRSVLLQQRSDVPVEFTALEGGSTSESAFMRDRYLYGVRARYNVGYGLWQGAYGGFL